MKFSAEVDGFVQAFTACAAARSARTVIEVLQHVHVSAKDGVATLTSTDTENTIIMEVPVECEQLGSVLLPGNRFIAILREASSEKFSLEVHGSEIKVQAGRAKYSLPTASADEFPLPSRVEGLCAKVGATDFQAALRKTVFAADPNSSRYALGGVRIEKLDEGLAFVATDGRRLSRVCLSVDGEIGDCTVPSRAATLILRASFGDELVLRTDTSSLQVSSNGTTIIARLLEGRFPQWKNILPDTTGAIKARVNAGDLMRAIRQASIVVDQVTRGVNFAFAEGKLSLSSSAAERGSATIDIKAEYLGEAVAIKMDYVYVVDFLKTLDGECDLDILLASAGKSVVFDDGQQAVYLVAVMSQ